MSATRVTIYEKANGFVVSRNTETSEDHAEIVVEGKEARKIGEAVLRAFKPARAPRKRNRKTAPPRDAA
jgi:hypothetical protein